MRHSQSWESHLSRGVQELWSTLGAGLAFPSCPEMSDTITHNEITLLHPQKDADSTSLSLGSDAQSTGWGFLQLEAGTCQRMGHSLQLEFGTCLLELQFSCPPSPCTGRGRAALRARLHGFPGGTGSQWMSFPTRCSVTNPLGLAWAGITRAAGQLSSAQLSSAQFITPGSAPSPDSSQHGAMCSSEQKTFQWTPNQGGCNYLGSK